MFDDDIDNPMKGVFPLLSDALENDIFGDVNYMLPFPVISTQGSAYEENSIFLGSEGMSFSGSQTQSGFKFSPEKEGYAEAEAIDWASLQAFISGHANVPLLQEMFANLDAPTAQEAMGFMNQVRQLYRRRGRNFIREIQAVFQTEAARNYFGEKSLDDAVIADLFDKNTTLFNLSRVLLKIKSEVSGQSFKIGDEKSLLEWFLLLKPNSLKSSIESILVSQSPAIKLLLKSTEVQGQFYKHFLAWYLQEAAKEVGTFSQAIIKILSSQSVDAINALLEKTGAKDNETYLGRYLYEAANSPDKNFLSQVIGKILSSQSVDVMKMLLKKPGSNDNQTYLGLYLYEATNSTDKNLLGQTIGKILSSHTADVIKILLEKKGAKDNETYLGWYVQEAANNPDNNLFSQVIGKILSSRSAHAINVLLEKTGITDNETYLGRYLQEAKAKSVLSQAIGRVFSSHSVDSINILLEKAGTEGNETYLGWYLHEAANSPDKNFLSQAIGKILSSQSAGVQKILLEKAVIKGVEDCRTYLYWYFDGARQEGDGALREAIQKIVSSRSPALQVALLERCTVEGHDTLLDWYIQVDKIAAINKILSSRCKGLISVLVATSIKDAGQQDEACPALEYFIKTLGDRLTAMQSILSSSPSTTYNEAVAFLLKESKDAPGSACSKPTKTYAEEYFSMVDLGQKKAFQIITAAREKIRIAATKKKIAFSLSPETTTRIEEFLRSDTTPPPSNKKNHNAHNGVLINKKTTKKSVNDFLREDTIKQVLLVDEKTHAGRVCFLSGESIDITFSAQVLRHLKTIHEKDEHLKLKIGLPFAQEEDQVTSALATLEGSGNKRQRGSQSPTFFSTESTLPPPPAKRAKPSDGSARVTKSSRAFSKGIDDGVSASNPRLGFFPPVAPSGEIDRLSPATLPSYKKDKRLIK